MSVIVNDRDVLLQAAPVRFIMPTIAPERIPGLPGTITDVGNLKTQVSDLEDSVGHLMNSSPTFAIRASALTFIGSSGTTSPSSITLTAVKGAGLVGTVSWSVFTGSATIIPSGDTCTVTGSSVTGGSVTIRAQLSAGGVNHFAFVTISRLGAISAQDSVDLTTQVTGQLAAGDVSGLGALAMLNTVNLNTQTVGSLNGATRVTNLGNLAYANAIAANQIGAGTLAAGVIYAGAINADNITSGTITGRTIRTASSGDRVELSSDGNILNFYAGASVSTIGPGGGSTAPLRIETNSGSVRGVWIGHLGTGSALTISPSFTGPAPALDIPTSSGRPHIRLSNSTALPAARTLGHLIFYNGSLCWADGTHWHRMAGTQLT